MKTSRRIFILFILSGTCLYGQGLESKTKHQNSFGLSFDMGGKMEDAPDIESGFEGGTAPFFPYVLEEEGYARAVGKSNFGFSLFWEHQWNFHKNHGLLFGLGASITTFDYDIAIKNITLKNLPVVNEHILGDGFRNSFFSLDLPVYYTYEFHTDFGDFNPFVGINVRNISYIINNGRNNGGIGGRTLEVANGDTTYLNEYIIKFGTKSIMPALMPTFGLKYSRTLKNKGTINLHLTMKLMLDNSNSPEVYLNRFDNSENGFNYEYVEATKPDQELYDSNGKLIGPKSSIYYRVNMTSFNVGISYSFK